ncbi:class I SAM-dependent methyltransferase [Actinoplanes regularis]|uniref:Methyltransferase domain-containing protein n=1 Tax=Actinoplanes regularis TaxID=52697 RepID=A0A239HIW9_9ACTN|nr:methyltransferase domain-containing protein [Actinoplanes regularis]GIE91068.1 methyltransferase [Actinoplanes regularis]SNS80773.1 Methyltransferase domain-containing protein [Actinoplanes regularis]
MADIATLRARNADFWARMAPGWVNQADRHDEIARPLGAVAIDWLRPQPGERVLDVGCGCGGTTAEIARAVAPSGSAVGLDLAEAMVATARDRFTGPGGAGPQFVAGDIETLDAVPGAPFDAVYSRMTLMLLADPVAGLATVRRSMRAGARLAATVFRDGRANPWLPAAMLGAAAHLGPLPPLPIGDEPGPFAFADATRVTRVLTAAGFADIGIHPYDVALNAPDDPEAVTEWLIEIGPAGAAYRDAEPTIQGQARAGSARLLERFRTAGTGYRLPTGLWLITAYSDGNRTP